MGVGDKLSAFVHAPDDKAHHVLGDARFVKAVDQHRAACGRFFGGFEDNGVPGDERGDDMAIGQMGGEVIGAKHRHNAMRLMPNARARSGGGCNVPIWRALGIGVDRNRDLVDDGIYFGARFPNGFARFLRNQGRKGLVSAAHNLCKAFDQRNPLCQWPRRPLGEGGMRGSNVCRHRADRAAPEFGARCRIRRDKLLGHRLDPISSPQRVSHSANGVHLCIEG